MMMNNHQASAVPAAVTIAYKMLKIVLYMKARNPET